MVQEQFRHKGGHLRQGEKAESACQKREKETTSVEINGKKRNTISVIKGENEKNLIKKIKEMKLVEKYIKDKEIIKTIYIQDKLINIIVK